MIKIIKTVSVKCDNCKVIQDRESLDDFWKEGWIQVAGLEQPDTLEFCSLECKLIQMGEKGFVLNPTKN